MIWPQVKLQPIVTDKDVLGVRQYLGVSKGYVFE
jgi:hypothetical protein